MCNIMGKSACEEQAVQLTMQLLRGKGASGHPALGIRKCLVLNRESQAVGMVRVAVLIFPTECLRFGDL